MSNGNWGGSFKAGPQKRRPKKKKKKHEKKKKKKRKCVCHTGIGAVRLKHDTKIRNNEGKKRLICM